MHAHLSCNVGSIFLLLVAHLANAAPAPVVSIPASLASANVAATAKLKSNPAAWSSVERSQAAAITSCQATSTPTAIAEVPSIVASIWAAIPSSLPEVAEAYVLNGIAVAGYALDTALGTDASPGASTSNSNPRNPSSAIYPKKSATDAPYSLTEAQLRAAIYIPPTFTYGRIPPVILFPGTGGTGYTCFRGNFIPLFTSSSYADPVWINVPDFLLLDAQVNAEYAAYALNYISGISNTNVSIIAWSQGSINVQWALKYWPSTRAVTSDFIPISGDFKGTIEVPLICPFYGLSPCNPSVYQQEYGSKFVTTLAANGGSSPYVPTTSIYSSLGDEVVEPQQGSAASAFLAGASNNDLQLLCPLQAAGSFVSHEGALYNGATFALVKDALTHAGPGLASRAVNAVVCAEYAAPGLTLADVLLTEEQIIISAINILTGEPRVTSEPPIMAYAA